RHTRFSRDWSSDVCSSDLAMFAQQANLDLVHVPYRGGALANTAVMTGEAQFSFATLPGAMAQVRANTLAALAVTTSERSPQLPRSEERRVGRRSRGRGRRG